MKNQDLISRQVVLDAIRRISLGQTDVVKVSMMTEDYVKKLPSVNPQKSVLNEIKTELISEYNSHTSEWSYCAGLQKAIELLDRKEQE